jgi:DNA polymerase-1
MPGPLLAVDAPSLLYRAFYALPKSITGPDGNSVNALLGTANLVLRAIEDHDPRAVVFCFGLEAAEYRADAFPAYHADRPPVPDELVPQWEDATAFFEAFGWRVEHSDSLEADDLLHSFAQLEEKAGGRALLMTGDRDMFQCATERVHVLYVSTGKEMAEVGPDEVRKRYGIPPELVPDFIALRGDPSDGIPGAKGVGEKTAADLLQRAGSLEQVVKGALRESPRLRSSLRDPQLATFKDMATLRDIDVELPPDTPTDYSGGAAAARERGMNRLAERLDQKLIDQGNA